MVERSESQQPLPMASIPAWVRLVRPRQWLKNALVLAAPGAAGVLFEPIAVVTALGAFAAFSLAASAVYVVNDILDAPADRTHPTKATRPIAAGTISPTSGAIGAGMLLIGAAGLATVIGSAFAVILTIYVATGVMYSVRLKHVPVVDILVVASGFVLRAVAGAAAIPVPVSSWFLIVTSAGALFVVTGKRFAEIRRIQDPPDHRPVLAGYDEDFLRFTLAVSSGVAVLAYCLWAFEAGTGGPGQLLHGLSAVPFLGALLRYAGIVFSGGGGEPEEVFLTDRVLQGFGATWAVVFTVGVLVA